MLRRFREVLNFVAVRSSMLTAMKTVTSHFREADMKKLIILAAAVLTLSVANAKAGVSFEISVGGHGHSHRAGHGKHTPYYAAPKHGYVVRSCEHERPRHRHHHGRRWTRSCYGNGHSHGHTHGHRH